MMTELSHDSMKTGLPLFLSRFGLLIWFLVLLTIHPAQAATISAQQKQLLDLVNAERAKAGLSRLQWEDHLAEAARAHTQLMAARKELSHQFPGEPPLPQRTGTAGAHFNSVAENVAYAGDVPSLHRGLMHSPHHRANILDPNSNAIGIGLAERDGELYVTEDFARLLPSYSSNQFVQQVIAAFNRLRRNKGLQPMSTRPDPRLQQAACKAQLNAGKIIQRLPGATSLAIFTAAQPEDLPSEMQRAAADRSLRRMQIGVCFKPDDKAGFSKYWVVAAFYPAP
jgi:uncharacterized protein YkwD